MIVEDWTFSLFGVCHKSYSAVIGVGSFFCFPQINLEVWKFHNSLESPK